MNFYFRSITKTKEINNQLTHLSKELYKITYHRCYTNEVICINELNQKLGEKYKESISF